MASIGQLQSLLSNYPGTTPKNATEVNAVSRATSTALQAITGYQALNSGGGVPVGFVYNDQLVSGWLSFYQTAFVAGDMAARRAFVAAGGSDPGAMPFDYTAPIAFTAAIASASNATPIVVGTTQQHFFQTGDRVQIAGVLGNTAANGSWVITVVSPTTFSLTASVGNAAYTSGGVATELMTTQAARKNALLSKLNLALVGLPGSAPSIASMVAAASSNVTSAYGNGQPSQVDSVVLANMQAGAANAITAAFNDLTAVSAAFTIVALQ